MSRQFLALVQGVRDAPERPSASRRVRRHSDVADLVGNDKNVDPSGVQRWINVPRELTAGGEGDAEVSDCGHQLVVCRKATTWGDAAINPLAGHSSDAIRRGGSRGRLDAHI